MKNPIYKPDSMYLNCAASSMILEKVYIVMKKYLKYESRLGGAHKNILALKKQSKDYLKFLNKIN